MAKRGIPSAKIGRAVHRTQSTKPSCDTVKVQLVMSPQLDLYEGFPPRDSDPVPAEMSATQETVTAFTSGAWSLDVPPAADIQIGREIVLLDIEPVPTLH